MLPDFAQSIAGSLALGLSSLVISVLVFAGIVLWVVRLDRNHVRMMAGLPLDSRDSRHEQSEEGRT